MRPMQPVNSREWLQGHSIWWGGGVRGQVWGTCCLGAVRGGQGRSTSAPACMARACCAWHRIGAAARVSDGNGSAP